MALGDPWIRARSDRPTHFTIGDCMPGGLGRRWAVFSSTGINFCSLLNLEDGVLVKYDRPLSFALTPPTTQWQRIDTDLDVTYRVAKLTLISPSVFSALIIPEPG